MTAIVGACFVMAGCRSPAPDGERAGRKPLRLPEASASHLPRWRGFNLIEKLNHDWYGNQPFKEEDFRLISALGFDFVRLPMDYRNWTSTNDWTQFDESVLKEIDQAVAWGAQYGIHVCLNLHRAPGYTVAQPPEPTALWTDEETQRVCAMHWAELARRYKGIPNARLSFNLFNEPPDINPAVYAHTVRLVLEAIRAQDPDRLVIADGLAFGRTPCEALIPLGVAQATRGYTPGSVSHYRAPWIAGATNMPPPAWPVPLGTSFLFGPESARKPDPIAIDGPFRIATRLRVRIGSVSDRARLVVMADGRAVGEESWTCDGDTNRWAVVAYQPEWGIYRNTLRQDRFANIPPGTRRVELQNTEGDWMTIDEIGFKFGNWPGSKEYVLALPAVWNGINTTVRFTPHDDAQPFRTAEQIDRSWIEQREAEPWRQLKRRGVGVMVGEFGAYKETPHDVVLRWMEDCLKTWQKAGMGWALWNLRGDFGILDSGRRDVVYEDFEGHKLDRKMLELLQKY